jgi:hypothetical protein
MTICLACEHLANIGEAIAIFRHRSDTIALDLIGLGASIIGSISEQDDIRFIFKDEDF